MLDVALAPDFATSGLLYFSFSEPRGGVAQRHERRARASSFSMATGGRLEDVKIIFQQEPAVSRPPCISARGSCLIAAATCSSRRATAIRRATRRRTRRNHLGKVVRITADGERAAGQSEAGRLAAGDLVDRTSQRAGRGAASRDRQAVDGRACGARGGDELNIPEKGKNYGWPVITYGRDYSGAKIGEGTAKAGLEQPVYYWDPSPAPSGAAFYTGDLIPGLEGQPAGRRAGRAGPAPARAGGRAGGGRGGVVEGPGAHPRCAPRTGRCCVAFDGRSAGRGAARGAGGAVE